MEKYKKLNEKAKKLIGQIEKRKNEISKCLDSINNNDSLINLNIQLSNRGYSYIYLFMDSLSDENKNISSILFKNYLQSLVTIHESEIKMLQKELDSIIKISTKEDDE